MLISIVLLAIFAVGAVSAADENITGPTEEVLSADPTEELEAAQGDFTELSSLVNGTSSGATLNLEKDYRNGGSVTNGIVISKAITIDGQGHTLDANNKSNIFRISTDMVTLKNINFINSYSKDYSAVYGNCTVINCSFTDCTTEKNGGALYNGIAYNSSFINCKAAYGKEYSASSSNNAPFCEGGAIYNGDTYNCYFDNCYAEFCYYYWVNDNIGYVYKNRAYGGAISNGNAYNCLFNTCYVSDKHSQHNEWYDSNQGGAIYSGNAYNSTFIYCISQTGCAISKGDAHNCYFENCYSNMGIIFNGNAYDSRFIDCDFGNKIIIQGNSINCTSNINTLICSDLTANYGEPIKTPITTAEGINGMPVTVKLYKNGKLTNTLSAITGSDAVIEAVPGNYIAELSCVGGDPLNVSLTLNKGSPKLALATDFSKSGETANVKVTMSKKASGYARITINGKTYRVQIKSGTVTAEVPDLADGIYDVTATYGGNAYHTAETITSTFKVGKSNQGITFEVERNAYDEILTANFAKDATGFARFIIGEDTYRVPIENGVAHLNVTCLKSGTYTVTLKYGGNYRYNAETVTKTLKITQQGGFTELSSLVSATPSGETLKLEKDYINNELTESIRISNAITIDGQGLTIDANEKSNIFYASNAQVILKNINFINSYSDYNAAVVGKCTIINCSFTNCYSGGYDYMSGAAIYGGDAYNCTFTDCKTWAGATIYYGNAYNCTFTNIEVGAIYYGDGHNCTFTDCNSVGYGTIFNGNAYDCTFTNILEGTIFSGDAHNCTFTNCYYYDYYSMLNGGAIAEGNAWDCLFVNCSAKSGGAIYNGNAYDSIFINCSSGDGSIISKGNYTNCTFLPVTLSCSNLTVNYGEGGKLKIRTLEGVNGLPINVKIYKDNKLINSFSTTTGSDLPIDAAPGNYIMTLTSEYANPLNVSVVVNKGSPKMALANDFAKSGETANVKISMSKKATGFVKITINGVTYRVQISSGVASVDVSNLADGAYTVKATYAGNSYHTAETMTATFHVGKFSQGMKITTENIKVGDTERIIANMAKDATGFVRFIIGNDTYKVAIENGIAYVDIKNLKAGTYSVTIKYGGNYKYLAETKAATFTVSKSSPELKVFKTTVDGKTVLTANIAADATGNVNFVVNGNTYKAKITNGVATLTLPDMAPGTYTLKSTYNGNYKYLAETKTRSITIK